MLFTSRESSEKRISTRPCQYSKMQGMLLKGTRGAKKEDSKVRGHACIISKLPESEEKAPRHRSDNISIWNGVVLLCLLFFSQIVPYLP